MKKLYSIQYLRGVAAVAVVIFHASQRMDPHAFIVGAAGVDIFFVISGFIMWVISREQPVGPGAFMTNRIVRIAPTYWIATGVMVIGALLGLFPNLVLTGEHVAASFAFLPARSPSNGEIWPVLAQGWTLNYEMAFYAVFTLSLGLAIRMRLIFLAAVFGVLVLARALVPEPSFLLHFYGRPIVLEFVAGAVFGKFWLDGARLGTIGAWAAVTLAGIGFACVNFAVLPYDVLVLAPCALLTVVGMTSLEANGRLPTSRALAYVGDASYSIYLWHSLAVSVVARGGDWLGLAMPLQLLLGLIGGVVAGLLAYEVIERPVTKALKRVQQRHTRSGVKQPQNV